VLRFYEGRNLREVGAVLGASEEATKKRVARALERLQGYFFKRGVDSTTAAIAEMISANSIQPAPLALAKTATATALAKGATASTSTLTLIKGALKIMAWTKAKTVVVVGVVAILAAATTGIVGFKLAQRHHPAAKLAIGLSPVMENATGNIQSDGTILFQGTVEETNSASRTTRTDSITEAGTISRMTDESGRPMKFTRLPDGRYLIILNKPVPPGGNVSYTVEGTLAGLIKANGAGEDEIGFTGNLGNVSDMHCVQVWRLPMGATLLGKNRGMQETTNDGQIELRIDKMVPPNGALSVGFRYRLAVNAP
jgi:hypothetical protein